ncbi:MAG: RecX family transcriptional regulator [Angelakisella sp.]
MEITDIQKTKKGRYAVFADGEFLFSVHPDSYYKTQLRVGLAMTVEELEQLRVDDQLRSAKEAAMNALSRAAQSSGMLRQKLSRYYDSDAVEGAIARMTELGLVDDFDYARRMAADCVNLRGYSQLRLRQYLRQKQLPAEAIEAALTQFGDDNEIDPIVALLLKKYRNKITDSEGLRKSIAALQRRGFGFGDIRAALQKIEEEQLL